MTKRIVNVAPLGTGIVLPAVVIGYEVTGSEQAIVRALPNDVPSWLWLVSQQAGGMAMSYPVLLGAILRLEANEDRGRGDVAFMVRGLEAMAEDPEMALLRREYPVLANLVRTTGAEYSSSSLADLAAFLAAYLRVPPVASGLEAFIRFESSNPLDYFDGWRMLQAEVPEGGVASIYSLDDGMTHIDDSNIGELLLSEHAMLSDGHLDALRALGAPECNGRAPSAFLLWENSD